MVNLFNLNYDKFTKTFNHMSVILYVSFSGSASNETNLYLSLSHSLMHVLKRKSRDR